MRNLRSGTSSGCGASGREEMRKRISGVDSLFEYDGGGSLGIPRERPAQNVGQIEQRVSEKTAPRAGRYRDIY